MASFFLVHAAVSIILHHLALIERLGSVGGESMFVFVRGFTHLPWPPAVAKKGVVFSVKKIRQGGKPART
jgi:hypothetical protein